ncbi:MAG: UDP-N-acetylmuramoyl-tripeptide--D-alanyl-D-alanine ligase [Patescibacteria group bacterium]
MKIIRGLIYILQRESYDARRFLAFVYGDYRWWALERRQAIDWTNKAKALYITVWGVITILAAVLIYYLNWWTILALTILLPLLPLLIILSLGLLWPLDHYLKQCRVAAARQALKTMSTTVIGITGSYGKTSLKEILLAVLQANRPVIATPDNVNTDLGIAEFILKNRDKIAAAAFFIVEMGAYQRGDIARICDLVQPAYSLLTGINEAHLERFGSLEKTVQAKFELAERTAKQVILNLTDDNVRANYARFRLPAVEGVDYSAVTDLAAKPDFGGWSFRYRGYDFTTRLLAKHNIILIAMALRLAERLGLDLSLAAAPLVAMPFVKHRLEPIYNQQSRLLVIDDSYNGNFQGFISGLDVLSRASGRKLVITPGLVELGVKKEIRHREIARLYADQRLDLVLLVENSATRYIIDEFKQIGFVNYQVYPSAAAAHQALATVLKPGDTIIFQNDWPDNYK